MEKDITQIVEAYHKSNTKSQFQKMKLIKSLSTPGFKISMSRIPEYLSLLEETKFIEPLLIKSIFIQLINLDISVGVEYGTVTATEWDTLLADTYRNTCDEAELSPMSINDSTTSICTSDSNALYKLGVLLKGASALIDYIKDNMNEELFYTLMNLFEERIAPCSGLVLSQFIFFSSISLSEVYTNNFLYFLSDKIFSLLDPRREIYLVYLCSFLTNSSLIVPSSLNIIYNKFLFQASNRLQKYSDKFSSFILHCLMHLSLGWNGTYLYSEVDRIIESVKDINIIQYLSPEIQVRYSNYNPKYTQYYCSETIGTIIFPFTLCSIPQVHDWIINYKTIY
ncbi:hypothetical protein NEOKW01_1850 [Nematocida sp. AWRm80]|nr:hypothetical protein NEOKW01_1850 [Nematocida sp. AWRm80]